MPYAGNDWNPMSPGEARVLSIDLAPYIQTGDALTTTSLTREFFPIIGAVINPIAIPSGFPYLIGTIANQLIALPPGDARYLLGFKCQTLKGSVIELYSYFWSYAEPPASSV